MEGTEKKRVRLASRKVSHHPSLAVTHADRQPSILLKVSFQVRVMNWQGDSIEKE